MIVISVYSSSLDNNTPQTPVILKGSLVVIHQKYVRIKTPILCIYYKSFGYCLHFNTHYHHSDKTIVLRMFLVKIIFLLRNYYSKLEGNTTHSEGSLYINLI